MLDYQIQLESFLGRKLKPNASGQVNTRCPFHQDKRRSLSINLEKGLWTCHAGCGAGNIFTLAKRMGKVINMRKKNEKLF